CYSHRFDENMERTIKRFNECSWRYATATLHRLHFSPPSETFRSLANCIWLWREWMEGKNECSPTLLDATSTSEKFAQLQTWQGWRIGVTYPLPCYRDSKTKLHIIMKLPLEKA